MATEKQIAANRANAQLSTGPRTEEGKARSALNGVPKGTLDDAMVISSESQAVFYELEKEYLTTYRPQGATERFFVHQMVSASWRTYRLWHAERAAIDLEFQRQLGPTGPAEDLSLPIRTSMAVRTLSNQNQPMEAWNRYESRMDRQFRTSLNALLALQAKNPAREANFCDELQ
jgi:hypothetical protein